MGIPTPLAELIVRESLYRPIRGDVAFVGRQTTYITETSIRWLLQKYNLTLTDLRIELDEETRRHGAEQLPLVTDRCFMSALGVKSFSCIDVSDYEGADIICDLSAPISPKLHERFDFVFDGSCLDNIFDPAHALANMSSILRPGGRMLMINHGSMAANAYTVFSPGWFFDFYVANGYTDCQVYLASFQDFYLAEIFHEEPLDNRHSLFFGPWALRYFNWLAWPNGGTPSMAAGTQLLVIVIAEKSSNSTNDVMPVQAQYRNAEYNRDIFEPNAVRILGSQRPILSLPARPSAKDKAFVHCGLLGAGIPF